MKQCCESNFSSYKEFEKANSEPIKDAIRAARRWPCIDTLLQNSFYVKVESGDNLFFWKNVWTDNNQSLQSLFPKLYLISIQEDNLVSDMGLWNGTR